MLGVLAALRQEVNVRPGASGSIIISAVLYAGVMGLLLLPKVLGAAILMRSPEKLKLCGSRTKVAMNVAAETFHSMLLAPILMLFYTRFVLASLCGFKGVGWGLQAPHR